MNFKTSIETIFTEIRNYNGNFGDPIVECINFNALELLASRNTSYDLGAGVGLLVNFSSHIDNATYEDAMHGQAASEIKTAIAKAYCGSYPALQRAFEAALESESKFRLALNVVYKEYIA